MNTIEQNLSQHFGFQQFREGQRPVIETLLQGHSAGAIFPTGSGKSLCYQLPALSLPGMTLVVSPLLSLMKDQIDFLVSHKIPAARLDSTLDRVAAQKILEDAKSGRLKILMIAVERFKNERFRFHLQQMNLSMVVIDEAHCISEWGHNFRPEYLKLPDYRHEFNIPQVLLLTATATPQVIDDMCAKFQLPREHVFVTGFYRKNLILQVSPVATADKKQLLLNRIAEAPDAPTIVYVTLQKTAEQIAQFLQEHKLNALPYHAGLKNEQRESIQNRFMGGQTKSIVATIAFGMGIDKRDIRRVLHYDLPKSIENYSQEIGRSGRDGQDAHCEVFANLDSLPTLENFIFGDTPDKESIRNLISLICQQPEFTWEFLPATLSNDFNIRLLPLRTLLVYLEKEGLIRPRQTYFGEYAFKLQSTSEKIIDQFTGERRDFVKTIFSHATTKKVWTYLEPSAVLDAYRADHQRLTAALEYFNEKGWIELTARRTTEVYDILNQSVDLNALSEKMYQLYKKKESVEIRRIHNMVRLLESDTCLSRNLAAYFGETLPLENCGHCSVCRTGKAGLTTTSKNPDLNTLDYDRISAPFKKVIKDRFAPQHLVRFLCGVYTPVFRKLNVKTMPDFGRLENYPYSDVFDWVFQNHQEPLL